ncbi:hypothetical protein [Dongia sp. agr-C8]
MKLAAGPIALLLAACLAPPAAAECGQPAHPDITVKIEEGPVREDRSLSLTDLSKIPSASRRTGMEAYDRTLGMTEADIGAKADIDLVTVPDGDGNFCTTARKALIVLEWSTVVRVAKQIPPGSCIDKVVTEHEQKHVAIDRHLIPIARQVIEIALTSVIRKTVAGKSIEDSQRNLQDQARATVNKAIDIFSVVRTRRQLSLDSKEEYDRVPRACGLLEYIRVLRDSGSQVGS